MKRFSKKLGEETIRDFCKMMKSKGITKLYTFSGMCHSYKRDNGLSQFESFQDFILHMKNSDYDFKFYRTPASVKYFEMNAVKIVREYFDIVNRYFNENGYIETSGPIDNIVSTFHPYKN